MKDITEYAKVFDRGFQGSNSTGIVTKSNKPNKDSEGIGLAISKDIALKHNGKLEMFHEKVSTLCVPFFKEYEIASKRSMFEYYRSGYGLPQDLSSLICAERKKLKKETPQIWDDLNAIPLQDDEDFTITGSAVADAIGKAIIKYTFVLSIPHKIREKE
jgi:hypothetical protein